MSGAKHTPGPWRIDDTGHQYAVIGDHRSVSGSISAHVLVATVSQTPNAHLIAALQWSIQHSPHQGESEETEFLGEQPWPNRTNS